MKKKVIFIFIILLYTINLNISTIFANLSINNITDITELKEDIPDISAKSAILMDMETNTILYAKNEHERHYPASITKILTTLIALEYNKPNDTITFSDNAVFGIDRSSSNLAMDVEEQISMKDALYGIMLMSANEVSAAVAEHIGGTIDNFARMMNIRAKEVGAINSNFENPHGLHDKNHYTTAYDMAMIAKEAYKLPEFRKIIGTITYQIEPTNKQPEIRYLANQHYMIKNTNYHYDYCTGGKTGFTDEAQSTLVTFAEKDGLKLVCVVLEEAGNLKYTDTISLFDYAFNNFKLQNLYVSDYPESLPIYNEIDNIETFIGDAEIYAEEKNINTILPKETNIDELKKETDLPEKLLVPLKQDDIIGKVSFYYNDKLIKTTNLKALKSFDSIPVSTMIPASINIDSNRDYKILKFSILMILISLVIIICVFITHRIIIKRRRRRFYKQRWRLK